MKAAIKIFSLFIVLQVITWIIPQKATAQVSVSFQIFYDDLSPYGNWIDNSDYGYVWVPNVSREFSPYGTNGYWVFTEDGWTWVSDYSWGWAPFHYGRWFYDSYYRWIWVPDNEWGPGWVSWRRSDDYYGWAPMGPGISIDIAYSNGYNLPFNQWRFVRNRDFGRTNINNYYINSSGNTTIIHNTTVINNIRSTGSNHVRYNAGPDRSEAERHANKTFTPVVLRERNKPGQTMGKGELQLYRPQVQKNNVADRKVAPSKVGGWKNRNPAIQKDNAAQTGKENIIKKEQTSQGEGNGHPNSETQRNDQPAKQQPQQSKHNDQPTKQQPSEQKRNDQPIKQQQPNRNDQPVRQQPSEQRHNDQPVKQQPQQPKRNDQPVRQHPSQQKHDSQPAKDQRKKSGEI